MKKIIILLPLLFIIFNCEQTPVDSTKKSANTPASLVGTWQSNQKINGEKVIFSNSTVLVQIYDETEDAYKDYAKGNCYDLGNGKIQVDVTHLTLDQTGDMVALPQKVEFFSLKQTVKSIKIVTDYVVREESGKSNLYVFNFTGGDPSTLLGTWSNSSVITMNSETTLIGAKNVTMELKDMKFVFKNSNELDLQYKIYSSYPIASTTTKTENADVTTDTVAKTFTVSNSTDTTEQILPDGTYKYMINGTTMNVSHPLVSPNGVTVFEKLP